MLKFSIISLLFIPLACGLGVRTPLRLDRSSIVSTRLLSTKESSQLADPIGEAFDKSKKRFLGEPIPYKDLTIGVLREDTPGETRVSQTPETVATLVQKGFQVLVESGGECLILFSSLCKNISIPRVSLDSNEHFPVFQPVKSHLSLMRHTLKLVL
jgi:hypothetical protein